MSAIQPFDLNDTFYITKLGYEEQLIELEVEQQIFDLFTYFLSQASEKSEKAEMFGDVSHFVVIKRDQQTSTFYETQQSNDSSRPENTEKVIKAIQEKTGADCTITAADKQDFLAQIASLAQLILLNNKTVHSLDTKPTFEKDGPILASAQSSTSTDEHTDTALQLSTDNKENSFTTGPSLSTEESFAAEREEKRSEDHQASVKENHYLSKKAKQKARHERHEDDHVDDIKTENKK